MKKRIVGAAIGLVMLGGAGAGPASADGNGPSACKNVVPGAQLSVLAQDPGWSANYNPSNRSSTGVSATKAFCNPVIEPAA